jgi:hypothetical protein
MTRSLMPEAHQSTHRNGKTPRYRLPTHFAATNGLALNGKSTCKRSVLLGKPDARAAVASVNHDGPKGMHQPSDNLRNVHA